MVTLIIVMIIKITVALIVIVTTFLIMVWGSLSGPLCANCRFAQKFEVKTKRKEERSDQRKEYGGEKKHPERIHP